MLSSNNFVQIGTQSLLHQPAIHLMWDQPLQFKRNPKLTISFLVQTIDQVSRYCSGHVRVLHLLTVVQCSMETRISMAVHKFALLMAVTTQIHLNNHFTPMITKDNNQTTCSTNHTISTTTTGFNLECLQVWTQDPHNRWSKGQTQEVVPEASYHSVEC